MASWSTDLSKILKELDDDGLDITGLGWSDIELTALLTPEDYEAPDDAEIDLDEFEEFDHKCPRCDFEWSD